MGPHRTFTKCNTTLYYTSIVHISQFRYHQWLSRFLSAQVKTGPVKLIKHTFFSTESVWRLWLSRWYIYFTDWSDLIYIQSFRFTLFVGTCIGMGDFFLEKKNLLVFQGQHIT